MKQVLVFKLGAEYAACSVEAVHEIIQYQAITPLPNMEHHVLGVTNVRGVVYPVISLARRLGLEEAELTKTSRIVIVDVGGVSVGMVVDDVTEVLKVDEGMEVPPPPMIAAGAETALISIIKHNDRLISFLDLTKVVDSQLSELVTA